MKKMFVISSLGAALVLAGCQKSQPNVMDTSSEPPSEIVEPTEVVEPVVLAPGEDPENASYLLEGQVVTLTDGKTEMPVAPGSATMVTISMFGEPVTGDLNGDGVPDSAVLLVVETGGSGVFYYQAAALQSDDMYTGTNGILLGDRIAPQTTQVTDQTIIANYAERAPGEPMTAKPSVGVSKYMQVNADGILVEIENPNQVPQ